MAMSFSELRGMAYNESFLGGLSSKEDNHIMTIDEAATEFLDEAFYGRSSVAPIQKAMDAIVKKVQTMPTFIVNGSPEAKALNEAIAKVFGCKRCTVYWSSSPGMMNGGPMTVMQCGILEGFRATYKYGTNKNGFYDKDHVMTIAIRTDQGIISNGGLTSEEMVAILLHELGHNFDVSPYRLADAWSEAFTTIINVITNPSKKNVQKFTNWTETQLITAFGKDAYMILKNLDIYIAQMIPPIGYLMNLVGNVAFNIIKFLNAALSPIALVTIPVQLLMTPFSYMNNIFGRKRETYADSFAAAYGYGAELGTGLEKMSKYMVGMEDDESGLFAIMKDIALLNNEVSAFCTGMHQSTQQRLIRVSSKLEKDLAQSDLSPADRAVIIKERDRVMNAYNSLLNADAETQQFLTTKFRQMVDNWYAGKPYMFIPIAGEDITYAQ